tara:strand:- start:168 stop:326 length:159 start_codon:yes stop_codon:yes gene_type:complete
MSKDIWCEVHEKLSDKLERDPSDKEMEAAYQDYFDNLRDHADMLRKQEREER